MEQFLDSIMSSAARISAAARTGPLDAPVRACPGWSLADLGRHIGYIHRWARRAVQTAAPPDVAAIEGPPADDELADWIDAGALDFVMLLRGLAPDAPTWHPFPTAPMVAAVWPRRQAHEALIHAWDAQHSVGVPAPLDRVLAADNVAEYFEVMIPRLLQRTGRAAPVGVLRVCITDGQAATDLLVRSDGPVVVIDPAASAEAELRGTGEDLALALWGRRPLVDPPPHPLVAAWLAFGGN